MVWGSVRVATLFTVAFAGVVLVVGAVLGGIAMVLSWLGLPPPVSAFVTVFGLAWLVVFATKLLDR